MLAIDEVRHPRVPGDGCQGSLALAASHQVYIVLLKCCKMLG